MTSYSMIHLAGSAKRSFLFPSNIQEALKHYAEMEHLFRYLPHIRLTETYSKSQFRVIYSSIELSIYRIQLYCDLKVSIDTKNAIITVGMLNGKNPIKPKAGLHSSRGMAKFISTSQFTQIGENTRIYYHLHLKGELPKPRAFSLVPDNITNHIAENIANRRIHEIADGFIVGSLEDYKRKN